ncbi:MAG: preprotein translocase subunit YajC [Geminicoccaceae bacterium]|nr:preprotein translocase subunit YajC [Geminicoccaceae bacterium]MCS7268867.1 preprotein translocase subunit YajC [Geminicoccaceae bacterium]MCX7630392.1 preprotein translocase subunit YajC [Geminicoccaceae bacterium]MDW8125244.1 preprotein translocase subunit YajC [Geminicoccaceae bacterium]MDW8341003.1 preprotein translocase subunit YajC [Geminicoccaceae bacterium]
MISPAFAQAQGAGGGDVFVSLLPLVLIFIVFYFLLIRPQQQKMKQHRAMLDALKKGDQVLTGGGIFGKVTRIDPDGTVMVEIAQGVVVKVAKGTISDVLTKPAPAAPEGAAPSGPQPGSGGLLSRFFKRS